MKKRSRQTQIPKDVLRKGYDKAVSNGFSLVMAAMTLLNDFPHIALGLSQLAQEEIGKSLSILAAFQLKKDQWHWFWNAWQDHQKKAHRAFLYELISPHRLEMRSETGERHAGQTKRKAMPKEKEASFYVDYEESKQAFVLPEENVGNVEMLNRTMTASYLAQKAYFIHSALEKADVEFRYEALRKSEERFLAISELNPFGALECDPSDGVICLSQSWLDMGGMTLEPLELLPGAKQQKISNRLLTKPWV